MGPFVLVDKSFLQTLSREEADVLNRHYTVFLCPVLLREIVGNLAKTKFSPDETLARVVALASKARGSSSYVLHDWTIMVLADLMNGRIKLQPGAPRFGGKKVNAPDGSSGFVIPPTEDEILLERWAAGQFTDEDRKTAEEHNKELDEYDLPGSQREMQELYPENKNSESLEDILTIYNRRSKTDDLEWTKIRASGMGIPLTPEETLKVQARWETAGKPDFKDFASYANYCGRVLAVYFLGITAELVKTGKQHKTIIDILYFLYLPFVQIFVSADNFHKDHFKLFARQDQTFIWGPELKADLKKIAEYRKSLSPEDLTKYEKELGNYPPFILDSITRTMWEKYCTPWKPGSGNRAIGKSPEEQKATIDFLNNLIKGQKPSQK